MEAKLIKQEGIGYQTLGGNDYYLILDKKIYHTNPLTSGLTEGGKLSYKNCQSIELGYDLDELDLDKLACDWHKNEYGFIPQLQVIKVYIAGFQKALEILGDKKFSEGDMEEAFADGQLNQLHNQKYFSGSKAYIQSLQQTEWDVEIVMEYVGKIKLNKLHEMKPKLDADGCLILKRK